MGRGGARVIDIMCYKQREDKEGFVVALMLIRSVFWDFAAVLFKLARRFDFKQELSCRHRKSNGSRHLFGVKGN